MEFLVDRGADIDIKDNSGVSGLDVMCIVTRGQLIDVFRSQLISERGCYCSSPETFLGNILP